MIDFYNRSSSIWAHPEAYDDAYVIPGFDLGASLHTHEMPAEVREAAREGFRKPMFDMFYEQTPEAANYEWNTIQTSCGCPEEPDATVRIITMVPKDVRDGERLPALFAIPGGNLIMAGTCENALSMEFPRLQQNKRLVGVFVEYRLAPDHEYPAAVNDCHAGYAWMVEHADELHIDTDKIIIHGISTGAQLALCLAFRLKRYDWCGAPMVRGIICEAPPMDDVALNDSVRFTFKDENGEHHSFDAVQERYAFQMYLGERYGDPNLTAEAVPNRAKLDDIRGGFPPVWFPGQAESDPGRDSSIAFMQLLLKAGVFCDYHLWGGSSHQNGGMTYLGERRVQVVADSIRDAIAYDFRRPWLSEV